jgi:GNAT superfamily N-acetyltransferase
MKIIFSFLLIFIFSYYDGECVDFNPIESKNMYKEIIFPRSLEYQKDILTIDYLCNYPDFLPELADWYFSEWSIFNSELTKESALSVLMSRLNSETLGICLVAIMKGKPIGMISICDANIPLHPEYYPCISHLCVKPEERSNGFGKMLLEAAIMKTRALGYGTVYLYTNNPTIHSWYEKLGWIIIKNFHSKGFNCKLMSYSNPEDDL